MMLINLVCPISSERVNSYVSRLTVFMNAVLMIIFLFTLQPFLLYIVTVDYGIRAMGYNNYSPLCILSSAIIKLIGTKQKMVDKAPKMFASRLGFLCALLGSVFITLHLPIASGLIIALFTVLAVLDSVFNLCVGCLLYHHLVFPFFSKA